MTGESRFVCSESSPLIQIVLPDHYLALQSILTLTARNSGDGGIACADLSHQSGRTLAADSFEPPHREQ